MTRASTDTPDHHVVPSVVWLPATILWLGGDLVGDGLTTVINGVAWCYCCRSWWRCAARRAACGCAAAASCVVGVCFQFADSSRGADCGGATTSTLTATGLSGGMARAVDRCGDRVVLVAKTEFDQQRAISELPAAPCTRGDRAILTPSVACSSACWRALSTFRGPSPSGTSGQRISACVMSRP